MSEELIPIGFIRAAQGLQGAVTVHAYSGKPDSLTAYGALQDVTGEQQFAFTLHGTKDKDFICRLKNVTDRTQAEALRGIKLFLPASKLPATAEDEFYHRDLVGLTVENTDGQTIGIVRSVAELGHSDALMIEFTDREPTQTELLLFTKQNVPFVSIKDKKIVVELPDGMFDDVKQK
ncbi:MAG TPA: ribosome maturation factor RimM [Alphaproteobacteria bacterium]